MIVRNTSATRTFQDQTGRTVTVNHPPRRIVSLVPSQTELLFDLGLGAEIVGVTNFCVHPRNAGAAKPRVGGPKALNFDTLAQLAPDLVIANREENDREQITRLANTYPTWVSDITTLEEAVEMIRQVGRLVGRNREAREMADKIQGDFASTPPAHIRAAYLIWDGPLMVAGGKTFIHEMMKRCGIENVFGDEPRYPVVTDADITRRSPDILMLSSEPYPFDESHAAVFRRRFPARGTLTVDGELFSWYGSRLLRAAEYFETLQERIPTAL